MKFCTRCTLRVVNFGFSFIFPLFERRDCFQYHSIESFKRRVKYMWFLYSDTLVSQCRIYWRIRNKFWFLEVNELKIILAKWASTMSKRERENEIIVVRYLTNLINCFLTKFVSSYVSSKMVFEKEFTKFM